MNCWGIKPTNTHISQSQAFLISFQERITIKRTHSIKAEIYRNISEIFKHAAEVQE